LFGNSKLFSKNLKRYFVFIKFIMCIYTILITVFNYFSFQYKNDDFKAHLLFRNQCSYGTC